MRFFGPFIFILLSISVIAQNSSSQSDTLSAPPELYVDDELPLLDDYGYFSDKNAIKFTPGISLIGETTTLEGYGFQFEKGGITSKITFNFSARYQVGYILYSAYMMDSVIGGDTMQVLGTDYSSIRAAKPTAIRVEFNPRLYFIENVGMYLGAYGGATIDIETGRFHPTVSAVSGFQFVVAKHLLFDSHVGVIYDNSGYGRMYDFPLSLRLGLSIGYSWFTKKSEFNFYE